MGTSDCFTSQSRTVGRCSTFSWLLSFAFSSCSTVSLRCPIQHGVACNFVGLLVAACVKSVYPNHGNETGACDLAGWLKVRCWCQPKLLQPAETSTLTACSMSLNNK